jgi:hypothetical protein
MGPNFQSKVASSVAVDGVVEKLHPHEVSVRVAVEVIEHNPAKRGVLQLNHNVAGHVTAAAAAKNKIDV